MKSRRNIAKVLLWVSMLMLAIPVVPHHHHGHHEWICLKHDLCAGHADHARAACTLPQGATPDGCSRCQDADHCDGDACSGHCCCHTGCLTHSLLPLAPSADDVLPLPQEDGLSQLLAFIGAEFGVPAPAWSRAHTLYLERLHQTPSVRAHALRAPPTLRVG